VTGSGKHSSLLRYDNYYNTTNTAVKDFIAQIPSRPLVDNNNYSTLKNKTKRNMNPFYSQKAFSIRNKIQIVVSIFNNFSKETTINVIITKENDKTA
jgi:hypothetical protein